MTTVEIINTIQALKKTDTKISLKIAIACAMSDNLDLTASYNSDENTDRVGELILDFLSARSEWPDLDEFCYRIQNIIDNNESKWIDEDVIAEAYNEIMC